MVIVLSREQQEQYIRPCRARSPPKP